MSQRTITITICDLCNIFGAGGKGFLEPVFVRRGQKVFPDTPGALRIDLCMNCDEAGCFRCYQCAAVHKHEADCKYSTEEILTV